MKTLRRIAVGFVGCLVVAFFAVLLPLRSQSTESVGRVMVAHCGDERYSQGAVIEELPKGFQFTAPGCAKSFVEEKATRDDFYRQLATYEKAGIPIRTVVFADHLDCKAYGKNDSMKTHEYYLREAARLIHADERSKNLVVRLCVHDMAAHGCVDVPERK